MLWIVDSDTVTNATSSLVLLDQESVYITIHLSTVKSNIYQHQSKTEYSVHLSSVISDNLTRVQASHLKLREATSSKNYYDRCVLQSKGRDGFVVKLQTCSKFPASFPSVPRIQPRLLRYKCVSPRLS